MQLGQLIQRSTPAPTWTGVSVATVPMWERGFGSPVPLVSSGALGRVEGYDSQANALRAARELSRGADRTAVAVIARDDRFYVQGLYALLSRMSGGPQWLHVEAALPARVGAATLRETAVVRPKMSGVVAVVDGSRTLPLR